MSPATLQGHLNDWSLNSEVFEMAGRIGIDCLTIELADVVPVLQQHGLKVVAEIRLQAKPRECYDQRADLEVIADIAEGAAWPRARAA